MTIRQQPTIPSSNHTPSHDFPKRYRLLGSDDFKAVFDAPIKKIHTAHLLAFIAKGSADLSRLGLAITKKKLKHAVARNRIKRLTREAFRQQHNQFETIDIVVIVKASYDKRFDIGREVDELFSKIHQKFGQSKTA